MIPRQIAYGQNHHGLTRERVHVGLVRFFVHVVEGVVLGVEEHQALWACVARDKQWLHHVPVASDAHVLQTVVLVHVDLKTTHKIRMHSNRVRIARFSGRY